MVYDIFNTIWRFLLWQEEKEIQHCIIHQIRNSTKYVSYKDLKALMADLKLVYLVPTEEAAREHLEEFGEKWGVFAMRWLSPPVLEKMSSSWESCSLEDLKFDHCYRWSYARCLVSLFLHFLQFLRFQIVLIVIFWIISMHIGYDDIFFRNLI